MIKCLTIEEQQSITDWYNIVKTPISEIAYIYGVSSRTIARVITDAGMVTPLARRNGDSYRAMQILKQYDVEVSELAYLLFLGKEAMDRIQDDYKVLQEELEDMPF
jgi:hypothetical protein